VGTLGAFTFVLHSHLPYVRRAGRWPHGEEWIHEAACETYIPLLQTLYNLKESGSRAKLTLGMTPILAEQLADADVLSHLDDYIDNQITAARRDMDYFEGKPIDLTGIIGASTIQQPSAANPHLRYLAEWYKNWFESIKKAFQERFNRDIIGAFKRLQDEGFIEITTSAATHAYLPLLSRNSSINGQLKTGIASYERLFGRKPTSVWLPECAYRPAYVNEDGTKRPGLETWIAQNGLKVFFSETHTITGGQPVGIAAGDVLGPYGEVKRRYVIPIVQNMGERPATTYQAYYVNNSVGEGSSGVTVIGRNNRTGQQVWSSDWGYPGDFDYREFHKKSGTSGLQYWRVTGAKVELGKKDYYHPDWAMYKVDQHAEHYAHLVGDLLRDYHNRNDNKHGIIASNYDAELFGHWWFEGVSWLGKVLRHLSENPDVELSTASEYVERHPPQEVLNLPESSWGAGGAHFMWDNGDTHWMWQPIHEAEVRMENLVAMYPSPTEQETAALAQAAREMLLLQSSDWAFLVTTGQAREYATQRFSTHLERFNALALGLESKSANATLAAEYYELDKVFPDIDYRWFAAV
jgi:1,4-alpha-glucan branching enzyme